MVVDRLHQSWITPHGALKAVQRNGASLRWADEADAYTPSAPNAPPPAVANANNSNLIANIERLKLDIERIVPLHGRVVPLAELYTTARMQGPR